MKKIVTKIIAFIFITIVVGAVMQAVNPIITNELALTQMENSNALFVATQTYANLKPIVSIMYICVCGWFGYSIGRDIRNLVKTNSENIKESN